MWVLPTVDCGLSCREERERYVLYGAVNCIQIACKTIARIHWQINCSFQHSHTAGIDGNRIHTHMQSNNACMGANRVK